MELLTIRGQINLRLFEIRRTDAIKYWIGGSSLRVENWELGLNTSSRTCMGMTDHHLPSPNR